MPFLCEPLSHFENLSNDMPLRKSELLAMLSDLSLVELIEGKIDNRGVVEYVGKKLFIA